MNPAASTKLAVTKSWLRTTLEHDRQLYCCLFSRDGRFVFAGCQDGTILRWPLESIEKAAAPKNKSLKNKTSVSGTIFEGHTTWVSRLAITADDKRLVSSDLHGTLIAWDLTSKKPAPAWRINNAHPGRPGDPGWIRAIAVTADGKTLISAGTDAIIRLWSVADGKPAGTLDGHTGDIFSLAVHPDGQSLVSGDIFGTVNQWDLSKRKVVRVFDAAKLHTRKDNFLADVGGVRSLAFDAKGTRLACGGMTDAKSNAFCPGNPAVLLFDWASGKQTQLLRMKKGKADDGPINALKFLADGTLVGQGERLHAVCSLEFWNPDDGKVLHVIDTPSGYDLDLHPDGQQICTPVWIANGRSGNGRHAKPDEYKAHFGHVRVYQLTEKPAPAPAPAPAKT
ncbi:MAG: hypothetical protein VB859_05515 [Planctomycetaceae bacterium]